MWDNFLDSTNSLSEWCGGISEVSGLAVFSFLSRTRDGLVPIDASISPDKQASQGLHICKNSQKSSTTVYCKPITTINPLPDTKWSPACIPPPLLTHPISEGLNHFKDLTGLSLILHSHAGCYMTVNLCLHHILESLTKVTVTELFISFVLFFSGFASFN